MAGKSGRPLLIDQSKGNKAANLQRHSGKANRICFISCQIHRRCRLLLSTSAQLIMNISNSSESFGLGCINKRSENQFPSTLMLQTYIPLLKSKKGGTSFLKSDLNHWTRVGLRFFSLEADFSFQSLSLDMTLCDKCPQIILIIYHNHKAFSKWALCNKTDEERRRKCE